MQETTLYRHFDIHGHLLYVGISLTAFARTAEHAKTSGWFKNVSRVELQTFETRQEAVDAERLAIATEGPEYNVMHQKLANKPGAKDMKMATLLRSVRMKKGWSLRDAAKHTGVSLGSLSKLESGEMTNPTLTTLVGLVRGYGIPLDRLIDIGPVKFHDIRRTEKLKS